VELNNRERQCNADYEWVLQDLGVQREQAGKVVAVHRRKIVGVGTNHRDALQVALRRPDCPPREEITLVFVEGRTVHVGIQAVNCSSNARI
jgi:hypothetical protein